MKWGYLTRECTRTPSCKVLTKSGANSAYDTSNSGFGITLVKMLQQVRTSQSQMQTLSLRKSAIASRFGSSRCLYYSLVIYIKFPFWLFNQLNNVQIIFIRNWILFSNKLFHEFVSIIFLLGQGHSHLCVALNEKRGQHECCSWYSLFIYLLHQHANSCC